VNLNGLSVHREAGVVAEVLRAERHGSARNYREQDFVQSETHISPFDFGRPP
jgi:hypothetical protein